MKDSSSHYQKSGSMNVSSVEEAVQEIHGACFKAFIGLISGRWI